MPTKTTPQERVLKVLQAFQEARKDTTVLQAQTFMALMILSDEKFKDVRQDRIGELVGLPQGLVSQHLKKFSDSGLLEKDFVPLSERDKTYKLTNQGKKLISDIESALKE